MSTTIVQLVEAPRRTPCRHCFSCRASTSPRSCDALVWSLVRCRVPVRYHEMSTYPGIYYIYIHYYLYNYIYIYILICNTHTHIYIYIYIFPTCQVRVVRFYQSCSPHPRPPPSSSSSSSSSSTTCASTSTSTVTLPTLGQALRQLRSSVRTAGPKPGTFPAQCAPLDLNLGPS